MHKSYVVDMDGRFVGAALTDGSTFRFVAVDEQLSNLDGSVWPTLAALRAGVRRALPCLTAPGRFARPDSEAAQAALAR